MSYKDELLGATGHFPQGKLGPGDEGELRFAVARRPDGKIIVHFGKEIAWLGLTPDVAVDLARSLCKAAGALPITLKP